MKHSELRRGNYVYAGNLVKQVSRITLQTERAGSWPVIEIGNICHYPCDLKPVPITEDWLKRLGFTIEERWPSGFGSYFYKSDRKVKVGMSRRFGITISLNDAKYHIDDEYMIDSVHELQNIYQNLTGEQL